MFRWGVIVAALLVIGSIPSSWGWRPLPWLGYLAPVHAGRSQRDQVAPRLNLKRRSFGLLRSFATRVATLGDPADLPRQPRR